MTHPNEAVTMAKLMRENEELQRQLSDEKSMADRMYDDWRCGERTSESSSADAYRKARGL